MICALMIYAPVMMAAETGTVAESMESGGYVYIRLENGVWIAANRFVVAKGDEIQYSGAMEMNNFESESPGDLVVAKGTVSTDVDLGYGYQYKVLLEEATFSPVQE